MFKFLDQVSFNTVWRVNGSIIREISDQWRQVHDDENCLIKSSARLRILYIWTLNMNSSKEKFFEAIGKSLEFEDEGFANSWFQKFFLWW